MQVMSLNLALSTKAKHPVKIKVKACAFEICTLQLLVLAIFWKAKTGLKSNLVYRWMAMSETAVHKNHNPSLYIY